MDQISVQVRFTIDNFSDALYFTMDEWANVTDDQIETMKKERYTNWKNSIDNPPQADPPVEDLSPNDEAI